MDELIAFMKARLDEDEARAENRLCIHCGIPVVPLRNAFGITGYSHQGVEPVWQGQRCPGEVTGAEPVQDPARVLREVEVKREVLRMAAYGGRLPRIAPTPTLAVEVLDRVIALMATAYSDHPDYRQEWALGD